MNQSNATFALVTFIAILGAGCSSNNGSPSTEATGTGGAPGGVGGSVNSGGQISGQSGGAGAGASGTGGASAGGTSSGGASGSVSMGGTTNDGGACCAAKECQPDTVQSCVCTDWHQSQCCTGPWDAICQTTAEQKCGAPHCAITTGTDPTKGACCATHASAGCSDRATETCVCGLLPDCCSKSWDDVCVQLVREEHCETGVRECVCTTWQQQSTCCDNKWTDSCTLVAQDKCGAKGGCP